MRSRGKILTACLVLYLMALFRVTVFRSGFSPEHFLETGILNLIPLRYYFIMLRNGDWWPSLYLLGGNIAWFVPLGMYMGAMGLAGRRNVLAGAAGLGISLVIESLQFVFGTGYADLDDLLLNTLGAWLGAFLEQYLEKRLRNRRGIPAKQGRTERPGEGITDEEDFV